MSLHACCQGFFKIFDPSPINRVMEVPFRLVAMIPGLSARHGSGKKNKNPASDPKMNEHRTRAREGLHISLAIHKPGPSDVVPFLV